MRECWWIYRSLARRVMGLQHYPFETLTNWEERQLFRQVMQDKPRHWGRFAAYVDRLDQQYFSDQAYKHCRNVQEDMPQLVPTPWTFVLHVWPISDASMLSTFRLGTWLLEGRRRRKVTH